jgi:hypothetical protein
VQPEQQPRPQPNRAEKWLAPQLRWAYGIIASGLVLLLIHFGLIKWIRNDQQFPAVRRIFFGWRLAITGIVVVMSLTVLAGIVFQKDFGENLGGQQGEGKKIRDTLIAILVVWAPAWLIHLSLLRHGGWRAARPPAKKPAPAPAVELLEEADE